VVYTLWYETESVGMYCAGTQLIVFEGNSVAALTSFPGSDIPPPQSYVLSYFFKHVLKLAAGVNFTMPLSTIAVRCPGGCRISNR
jgi:hypothetical protein